MCLLCVCPRWVEAISRKLAFVSENDLIAMAETQMSLHTLPQASRDVSTLLSCGDIDEALHLTVLRDVITEEAVRVGVGAYVELWIHLRVYELVHPLTFTDTEVDGCTISAGCSAVLHTHAMRIFQRFIMDGAPTPVTDSVTVDSCSVLA